MTIAAEDREVHSSVSSVKMIAQKEKAGHAVSVRDIHMKNKQLRKKGVHVTKGQSALEAIRNSVPHWIHHTVKDEHYIGGVKYLPECECSECGYVSNTEHPVCPHCGARMHQLDS